MNSNKKVEYLVTDTSAFIKNAALQEIGNNIITEPSVVNEITSKRQLRRLIVLPYDLTVQEAFPENIKFVTEFAKKTGDYLSLSATDIKVIALTYQFEKEKVGIEHLKTTPQIVRTINDPKALRINHPKCLAGFYLPENDVKEDKEQKISSKSAQVERILEKLKRTGRLEEADFEDSKADEEERPTEELKPLGKLEETDFENSQTNEKVQKLKKYSESSESNYDTASSDLETNDDPANLVEKFQNLEFKESDCEEKDCNIDDILRPIANYKEEDLGNDSGNEIQKEEEEEEEEEDGGDENDDEGWITPGNIKEIKKEMDAEIVDEKQAIVGCLTTDFAMQNVLMQIGLNIASLDGKVIKQMRTFILRCYACFKTTSIMTKAFCPNCGYKTLKKVSISVDENGKQHMHINFKKPISAKGKKFSLPTFRGGKHANNPIICEDQPRPDQKPSRLARTKNDPLKDEFIAGYSPFVTRDVNSKSAMLGIRSGGEFKHWMKKNPNESRRRRK